MLSIGIDTHKASLAVSAVDELGRQVAGRSFANDPAAHRAVLRWAVRLGSERRFGIEGAGSFGFALAQTLVAAGETVVDVPPHFTARERRTLRQRGKSDPGDALAIARLVAREPALRAVRTHGSLADLKLLVAARDQLVAEQTRLVNQLHADLLVLSPGYAHRLPNLVAARHRGRLAAWLAEQPGVRAELARGRLARLDAVTNDARALERRIGRLVAAGGSRLPDLAGVGPLTAAKLLAESRAIGDYRDAAAFAAANGTAPLSASSGQVHRHRLNRGGNRQLNRALHLMALVQARCDPRARSYLARKRAEGQSWQEALRSLKRHLSDVVYRQMLADAQLAVAEGT
jgi:transposase